MKYLKRVLLFLACAALLICAGCKTETYYFYTNIPSEGFEIADKNFKIGEIIEGYVPTENEPAESIGNYSSMGYGVSVMGADTNWVVSCDFEKEGAKETFSNFCKIVVAELKQLDRDISTDLTSSYIKKFNDAAPGAEIEISKSAYEVLNLAIELYGKTEGYYNPALYYNIHAYGFGTEYNYPEKLSDLPADEDIAKYTDLASHFADVKIKSVTEEGNIKYYVTKPEYTVEAGGETLSMKIDLGGIGKGYAVDMVEELFDAYGYKYSFFNFGNSSMFVKNNPVQGNYTMLLKNPRKLSNEYYIKILACNEKLSTSGDNIQSYFIDGTRYCHIINPFTGRPIQTGIMSATIIGGSAAEDDAYTTAIMAMGKEKAIDFIKNNLCDRKVVFVCE